MRAYRVLEQIAEASRAHALRLAAAPFGAICLVGTILPVPVQAAPAKRTGRFDIPPQALAQALDELARQAHVQILYPYGKAVGRRSPGLRGEMTVRVALERLLRGSGLAVVRASDHVVVLHAAPRAIPKPMPRLARRADAVSPPPEKPPPPEIVVTGRAAETPLDETALSYAVTQFDSTALVRARSVSTADLFKLIPGFWVEASGGEASNNVRSRGIPTDGYSSVAMLEDGLPIQYDGGLGYLNTDQAFRIDATIDRAEAVRGGPSAIFIPNAPGGSVNFLTRGGLHRPGFVLSGTAGSFGYERVDAFAGGAIAPNLGVSLGGFYRADDGLRAPGYPADRGGQIRAGVEYDDGKARLSFNVKRLDDSVILYLPVPLRFDAKGQVRAVPGFDPLTDTLAGPDNVHVAFKTPAGPRDFDLSQGTHSRITFTTASGRLALGERSAIEVKARLRAGTTLRNGLFPVGRPMTDQAYLESVATRLKAAYPGMTSMQIRYADGGTPFGPGSSENRLVAGANLLSVWMPMDELSSDARLNHRFEYWGHHETALGLAYDHMRLTFNRTMGSVLLDVRGQARRLDVVALDAVGQQVGALTDNGFIRYGSLFDAVSIRSSNLAIYLADEWKIASDWRIDLGARWERICVGGGAEQRRAVDLGDPTTLADDAYLVGTGMITPIDRSFSGFNGTIGVNYNPSSHTGLFVRLTRIARLPSASEFYTQPNRTDEAVVPITMAEAGLTLKHGRCNLSAVAFATRFARLPFTDYRFDTASYAYVERTSIADTATVGLELAAHAELLGPLQLDLQATLQSARYRNFRYIDLSSGAPVQHDFSGNQLIRVPRLALRAAPSLHLFDNKLSVGLEFVHYSQRFADIANSQRLPAFSLLNAEMSMKIVDHVSFALRATNLTNTLGLTEGNPRVGSFDTQGMPASYFFARPEFGRNIKATLSVSY
jgi:outer membrane receptor protein involved in Fe transport